MTVPRASASELDGAIVVLGEKPYGVGRSSETWFAVMRRDGGVVERVAFRRATELAQDGEPYLDFVRTVQLRNALSPGGAAAVYAVLGDRVRGQAHVSVEEFAGEINLRSVLAATSAANGSTPIGFALHVARAFAALFACAEQIDPHLQIDIEPSALRFRWDGRIRALPKPHPRWSERDGGAMVMLREVDVSWLAPERIQGFRRGLRGEMYTFGVMFFEVLAGVHPLHAKDDSTFRRLQSTIEGAMPAIASIRRDVPPLVASIVDRCTRRDARERFSSWTELVAALDEAGDRIERLSHPEVAAVLAALFPTESRAAADLDEQLAMLDLAALAREVPSEGLERIVLSPLPHAEVPIVAAEWDERTDVDIDVQAWGEDARPMIRAGDLLVDARPVTNAEYARFTIAAERAPPAHWAGSTPPISLLDLPVTWVSHDDAVAYALWARKRLPTAEEWERAMNDVGERRLFDGTVWEWTATTVKRGGHIVRGGRWRDRAAIAARPDNTSFEDEPAADVGFRTVVAAPKT